MTIKVLGIIPARFGSTRFMGKPLASILGKTLVQRTYENARLVSALDKLLVATDDMRIFEHVEDFGGHAIMTSVDCLTGTDRLFEVLDKHPEWQQVEAIVHIQGDEPCICPRAIESAVNLLLENPNVDMTTLVTPLKTKEEALNPSIVKCVFDCHSKALYFSRNCIPANKQLSFNPRFPYYRHIGLYVYRPKLLMALSKLPPTALQLEEDLEQLKVLEHGYEIKVAITNEESVGVDTPQDLQQIEKWLCNK